MTAALRCTIVKSAAVGLGVFTNRLRLRDEHCEMPLARNGFQRSLSRGKIMNRAMKANALGRGGSPNRPRAIEVNRPYFRETSAQCLICAAMFSGDGAPTARRPRVIADVEYVRNIDIEQCRGLLSSVSGIRSSEFASLRVCRQSRGFAKRHSPFTRYSARSVARRFGSAAAAAFCRD